MSDRSPPTRTRTRTPSLVAYFLQEAPGAVQQPHDELEGHAAADQALLLADDLYVDVARRMKVRRRT